MKKQRSSVKLDALDEDVPALMLDRQIQLPAPLDKRLASLILRSTTNNPSDGYDLLLSASFGSERITLASEELEISVLMSLYSANVELQFLNSDYSVSRTSEVTADESWRRTEKETLRSISAKKSGSSIHGIGELNAEGRTHFRLKSNAAWRKSSQAESTAESFFERAESDWHLIGSDTIRLGRLGRKLDGQLISDFAGWRVTPKSKVTSSGVLARINVREDWIKFDELRYEKAPSRILQQLNDLFRPEHSRRRELFLILLRMLAQRGLQSDAETKNATIGMEGIFWRPTEENFAALATGAGRGGIAISGAAVEAFLTSSEGYEEATLIALGIKKEFLLEKSRSEIGRGGRGAFVPQSSPLKAVKAFQQIQQRPGQPRALLDKALGRNELRDLSALGLLVCKRGGSVSAAVGPLIDAEIIVRRAVSKMPSIRIARAVLQANPGASAGDIADAVAVTIEKNWAKAATKQRHGAAVRRWTLWLEPHLVDPMHSSDTAALVAGALRDSVKKGAPGKINAEVELRLRQLSAKGTSARDIATELGVSHAWVYDWQMRLGLRAKSMRRIPRSMQRK